MRGDAVGKTLGDLGLGQTRPFLRTLRRDQMDLIVLTAERAAAGRDVVRNDPVAALAAALGDRLLDDRSRFGGETDDKRGPVFRRA